MDTFSPAMRLYSADFSTLSILAPCQNRDMTGGGGV